LKNSGQFHLFVPIESQRATLFYLHKKYFKPSIQEIKRNLLGHIHSFADTDILHLMNKHGFKLVNYSYSYHAFGQLQDIIDMYYLGKKEHSLWIKILYKLSFIVLYKIMYLEDSLRRYNNNAIGFHLTVEKKP
jgi:hypothetical protein